MNTISEVNDLMCDLERADKDQIYNASLVSVLMYQRRVKSDSDIEKRLGFSILPEHRMMVSYGDVNGIEVCINWNHVPKIGVIETHTGNITINLKGMSVIYKDINIINMIDMLDNIKKFNNNEKYMNKEEEQTLYIHIATDIIKRINWLTEIKSII